MIEYNPLPSIIKFHESPARVKVLWGPLGTGKTSGAIFEFILQCQESTMPLDGMAIRGSYRELRDSTVKTFFKWFGDISEWRESDSMAFIRLPSADDPKRILEHILRFRSLDKPEDAKKVQSFEGAFCMLDEVVPTFAGATMRASEGIPLEIAEYTNARLRHEFKGQHAHRYTQVIVANPPPPSHWLYKHYIAADPAKLEKKRGGVSIHFVPRAENVKNLPPDYYEILSDAFHDPDMVRRLVDGEIVTHYAGVAVFPETSNENFTSERLPAMKGVPLMVGWDYGLTPATLFTQLLPNGQWRWLSEVQSFNHALEVHLDLVVAHIHDNYPGFEMRHWGDPAGAQRSQTDEKTCVEMAAKAGFTIRPGRLDWQSRKESIKQRLLRKASDGKPGVLISRTGCPLASEGMAGAYRYPKNASGEIGTRPIKNHVSHLIDSAQMIATREFNLSEGILKPDKPPVITEPPRPLSPFRPNTNGKPRGNWLSQW